MLAVRVLVTGGCGFIGSHIVDALLADGHDVCVVDDLSRGQRVHVPAAARLHVVDVRSPALHDVLRVERPEVVFHEAALAIVPSHYAEILPLAALEAMAAGLPVVAARAGGLAEMVPEAGLYPAGDVGALGERVRALWGDAAAGEHALKVARERTAPAVIAAALARVYA